MGIFRLHLTLSSVFMLGLLIQGCQSSDAPPEARTSTPSTGEEWVIVEPDQSTPPPANGAESLKAGIVWLTDGSDRLACRYWIELAWNAQAGAYVSKGRLPLSPQRPPKMEILLDARPWTVGNNVRLLVEPLAADALSTAQPLATGQWFERAARDYVKGPQVGAVLQKGVTDLMGAGRPFQNVRLTVVDPERKQTLFTAVVKLAEVADAPSCE